MRQLSALIIGVLFALSASAQEPNSENVRLVATGEIRKIDAKKKTFEFKITLDAPTGRGSQVNRPQTTGRPGGGGRRGGGGVGFPRGGGQGRPTLQAGPTTLQVKVFTSEKTTLKESSHTFDFSTLKVGQSVAVTATHRGIKGNDLDALVVDKTPAK